MSNIFIKAIENIYFVIQYNYISVFTGLLNVKVSTAVVIVVNYWYWLG
jgi:hypothetical protein